MNILRHYSKKRICAVALLLFGMEGAADTRAVFAEGCPDYWRVSQSFISQSWTARKKANIVMQSYDYSCGAAALATLLHYYWNDPTGERDILTDLTRQLTPDELNDRVENGLSLSDLKKIADTRGYRTAVGELSSVDKLRELKVPVIVGISPEGYNHFVVLKKVIGSRVFVADPIRGNLEYSTAEFSRIWIKNALLLVLDEKLDQSSYSRLVVTPYEMDPQRANRPFMRRRLVGSNP